jgi:polyisoprenoid-binding protein YceI
MKMNNAVSIPFSRSQLTALFAITTACLITGCSDPSDKVAKTAATDAKEVAKPAATAKDYVIRAESTIGFVGSKVTGSHDGGFKKFAGKVSAAGGKVTAAEVKLDMDSTWGDNERLTGHLKSADFFDVPNHPTSTFTVTGVELANGMNTVTGHRGGNQQQEYEQGLPDGFLSCRARDNSGPRSVRERNQAEQQQQCANPGRTPVSNRGKFLLSQ